MDSGVLAPSWLRNLLEAYADRPDPRSVAVVGNQPLPADEQRAKAIDSCDIVFRVNGFVCDEPGGQPAVGSRTHVVVFNRALRATKWVFRDYRSRLYLLVEPGRLHWEPDNIPQWWPEDLGFVPVSNRDVTLPLSDALGLDSRTEERWATTGTMAAWMARTAFPEADLVLSGFSFVDDPHQTSWQHAAGDSCIVGPEHQIMAEGRLLGSWTKTGRTKLLR
ncbi:Glycosyltransferase family 29 (sialyltransferase) [Prauserella marina]|uniref:Glycosyltransferase family 29 (Sialyltransferase) n=1 Tax=Prauserella marina TaxID=530584 RepID=A0A1G6NHD1_9PSEU|nr:glycosyl transferase family 29 (putative sialyltransferase) [Prauserella marina]SDC67262.1 Glycosyltransferase family 29 (sialyltransferase) [Prauserella marina]